MIKIESFTKKSLIDLYKEKNVGLEGNITKLIDSEDDEEFKNYLKECELRDTEKRKKRLDMTKKIQKQNQELQKQFIELCKNNPTTTNLINNTNSHNKTFNLQFFLNEEF